MPRLYSLSRWSSTLFHFGYILSFFASPFSLLLLDSLLNLLDMPSSLCVGKARFELALNAINCPLVRHFCLILNNPLLIIRKLWNLIAEIHAAIFIDVHTLLCSNLFALSDTPNIVTPDTTPRPQHRGPPLCCATQKPRSQRRAVSQHGSGGKGQAFSRR